MISEDFLRIKADSASKLLEAGLVGFLKTRIYQAIEKAYQETVETVLWPSELATLEEKYARIETLVVFLTSLGYTPHQLISELSRLEREIEIWKYGEDAYKEMKENYLSEVFQEQASDNERIGFA